ncbi:sodium:proton antiporter [Caldisalinibacter kiritimatiensis]|uniref:NADH-ubiquinone oxidoreductase, chain 4L n=1 Tax=Caldisalinibacter kiritimatiensis TaxID=1304284 RepID=R1CZ67_9FIRM|nr:cation:proton antiporter subunit C [Caldisalinibacter kiritimatiensis]EOD01869.1 NADH-ubiquinone oxidoreductase, chain 4L [Caldisalinibacter kiritimatiensis]
MKLSLILSFILLCIGIYGIAVNKNIIKSIILYNILQSAIIVIFLNFGAINASDIPIISKFSDTTSNMVDPLPQALMITAIVIGAAITALALMLSIKIFHYYGTLNWKELIEREG